MDFPFNFISPIDIKIEETSNGVAIIEGTLLKEGVSRNGNLYTIEDMENIAEKARGVQINFGVVRKIDDTFGALVKTLHDETESAVVGKIMETFIDAKDRAIKFIGHVVNTDKYPDIINRIKAGWGVSIGGWAKKAMYIPHKLRGMVLKIKDMLVTHVQLVPPNIVRGQAAAQVEKVHVQEVMIFQIPPIIITVEDYGSGYDLTGADVDYP